MIQINGLSVSFLDDEGTTQTVDAGNWEKYSAVIANADKQAQAARDNTQAQSKYLTELANFQTSVDAGRASGMTPPAKPALIIVSDMGTTTHGAFVPPLPDPIYPVVTPSSGSIKATNASAVAPTPAEQAIIAALLSITAALKKAGLM